jgi:hypothetical protein
MDLAGMSHHTLDVVLDQMKRGGSGRRKNKVKIQKDEATKRYFVR